MSTCAEPPARQAAASTAASLLLHGAGVILVALWMALMAGSWAAPDVSVRKKEPPATEVTIDLAALMEQMRAQPPEPAAPANKGAGFVLAAENATDAGPLPDATRESSINMRASSARDPIAGADINLPNQDGVDLPMLSLNEVQSRDGADTGNPRPAPPVPQPAEELAAVRPPQPDGPGIPLPGRPAPAIPAPSRVTGATRSRSTGGAPRLGGNGAQARKTPSGVYTSALNEVMKPEWKKRTSGVRGLIGNQLVVVSVDFEVDAKGNVSNARLTDPGSAPPIIEDCALTTVLEAKLPPLPDDLQEELRNDPLSGGRFRQRITFQKLPVGGL